MSDHHQTPFHFERARKLNLPPFVRHLCALVADPRIWRPHTSGLQASASMFVRYDDEKPQFMQACLTGVQGTPYESGCFIFDIYMPDTYPQTNCLVTHVRYSDPRGHCRPANRKQKQTQNARV